MAKEKEVQEEVQAKGSSLKFIVMGVLVVLLGAGGFLGWNMFMKGEEEATASTENKAQDKTEEMGVTHPMEPFIVNLMDKAGLGKRYLKVKIMIEVGGEEDVLIVGKYGPQLRDSILMQLSSRSFSEINNMEGKIELKQILLSRMNQILGEGVVRRIYFTDFVVQ